MNLFEKAEQLKEKEKKDAKITIAQYRDEILHGDFSNIGRKACEFLADGTVTIGQTDEENTQIKNKAQISIDEKLSAEIEFLTHEDFIRQVAEGRCSWDCDQSEREKVMKEVEEYRRNRSGK